MKHPVAERGFSLVEIIITIVIIAIALTAAISGWGTIARHSSDVMWQTRISYLGQAYLEEILSRPYDELTPLGGSPACSPCTPQGSFGPDGGEVRSTFDDVDDYHGLSESAVGLFNELVTSGGIASYRGYQVDVSVTYAGSQVGITNELVKQVTVTVTPPQNTGQSPVNFSALRGNY
ncbi:prepilin-type N-terminal cleavage/methylation domain-containing protein [Neptuniibacter caesariensis]|uniref:Putative MSHA pilin protein MshD n=1 Tax=Neptuniibacter caesariensis TaxID=207954 RepID=A0A7U8GSF5_NEPCE|nr:prepilin-type N-terminal cleavage/methylation domain-containing protein [Neptuniibacter caesariensis]EAR61207.1 putative MSHA pilin protein MshD [Oceanospirillum sp. MED92] [Neptuniibacter caesariensis]